jgi:hypothetical protein
MSLGEVTRATAAFVTVQEAFNWLVDNYPRSADWASSANRVDALLELLDGLDRHASAEHPIALPPQRQPPNATVGCRSALSSFRAYTRGADTAHRRGNEMKRSQSGSSPRKEHQYDQRNDRPAGPDRRRSH